VAFAPRSAASPLQLAGSCEPARSPSDDPAPCDMRGPTEPARDRSGSASLRHAPRHDRTSGSGSTDSPRSGRSRIPLSFWQDQGRPAAPGVERTCGGRLPTCRDLETTSAANEDRKGHAMPTANVSSCDLLRGAVHKTRLAGTRPSSRRVLNLAREGLSLQSQGLRWSEACRDQESRSPSSGRSLGLWRVSAVSLISGVMKHGSVRCALIRVDLVVAPETTEGP
jgi:hypothetical protein